MTQIFVVGCVYVAAATFTCILTTRPYSGVFSEKNLHDFTRAVPFPSYCVWICCYDEVTDPYIPVFCVPLSLATVNRPFAVNDHMVQKPPCW